MHLLLDGKECNKESLNSMEKVHTILHELPEELSMKKLSSPCLVRGNPPNIGVTGFIVIEESTIMIHTFPDNDFISADVYSCKDFDCDLAIKLITDTFEIKKVKTNILKRGIK